MTILVISMNQYEQIKNKTERVITCSLMNNILSTET